MHLHSFIAAVGLVATTNAILLPPGLPISENDIISTLPVPTKVDVDAAISKVPETQILVLNCPGCLRRGRQQRKEIPSHLELKFSVESTDGPDRLTVNGYELYPNPDPLRGTLTAPVFPDITNRRMRKPPRVKGRPNRPRIIQPLGFGMQTQTVTTEGDHDLQLINIEIQIVEVGNIFTEGIPNVQVKLVKTPSGKLAIGTIETIDSSAAGPGKKQKVCSTMLCRWKTLLFEKLARLFKLKGCSGSPAGTRPDHHREGAHGGDHHGHHMSHQHRRGNLFLFFVAHILLPVLIGIVAGISASIIGMMAGTFIVFLWRRFFRRSGSQGSHGCRYAHKAAEHEIAVEDEKSGLMDHQEGAEAPPAYVEAGLTASEDKKPENEE